MKVYVITKGEYSDYHICGVALDEERAKILAKKFSSRWDDAEVEEYDTEKWEEAASKNLYSIRFDEKGHVEHLEPACLDYYGGEDQVIPVLYGPGVLKVEVLAEDSQAAIKIAAEKRAKYLAEQAGL